MAETEAFTRGVAATYDIQYMVPTHCKYTAYMTDTTLSQDPDTAHMVEANAIL